MDREELIKEMLSDLKRPDNNVGYALYGKRRVGKTSILKEIKRRLDEDAGIVTIYFSFWELLEDRLSEFLKQFAAEILEGFKPHLGLSHKAKYLLKAPVSIIKETIKNMDLSVKLKEDIEILLTFEGSSENLDYMVDNAFDLPEKLAEQTGKKCVLLIDEFPSVMDLRNGERLGQGIVRKIRTIHESQRHVALCISGSIRKTMSIVALSPASAFYRQFVVREVKPLEKEHVRELLLRNMGISSSKDVIEGIYLFSGGIPFYIQFIGRILEKHNRIDTAALNSAIDEFLEQEGNILFKEELEAISSKEKKVLVAIAFGKHTPKEISSFTNEEQPNIGRFLFYLEEKGYVTRQKKGYYVIDDPVFERWLKKRF